MSGCDHERFHFLGCSCRFRSKPGQLGFGVSAVSSSKTIMKFQLSFPLKVWASRGNASDQSNERRFASKGGARVTRYDEDNNHSCQSVSFFIVNRLAAEIFVCVQRPRQIELLQPPPTKTTTTTMTTTTTLPLPPPAPQPLLLPLPLPMTHFSGAIIATHHLIYVSTKIPVTTTTEIRSLRNQN